MADHFARRAEVFILASVASDLGELGQYFGLSLARARLVALESAEEAQVEAEVSRLRPDVFVNNSYGSELRNLAPRGIYMCMFPHAPSQGESGPLENGRSFKEPSVEPALRTYTAITANSLFTRRWIRRLWHVDSSVVYSPCDSMGPALPKRRRILHVGRFSDPRLTPHRKRQDALIEKFASMVELHREDWRLDLAGSVDPSGGGGELERLRRIAESLPVDFHPDVSRESLRRLYQEAAVYWHATGFGSNEGEAPEEQEHFGVSIVEAMSAGAVPLVRDAGGPREIVRNRYDGYRWASLEELQRRTAFLVSHPARRDRMASRAMRGSRRFSREKFLRRVDRLLG